MIFLKEHIISKIEEMVKEKSKILDQNGFMYFDTPIVLKNKKQPLNRFNKFNPYQKEEIIPLMWKRLDGVSLIESFEKIKTNKFYSYRRIEGKDYKVRIKS